MTSTALNPASVADEIAKPLRVLHVMPWFYPAHIYGGPVQSVYDLAAALTRAGCEVRVLTTNANGATNLQVETSRRVRMDGGFDVLYCPRWLRNSVSPRLLMRLAGEVRWADVVHIGLTYSFPVIPTLALCRILQKPVVWSPRGALQRYPYTRRKRPKAIWEKVCSAIAPAATVLHVTSAEEQRESTERIPRPAAIVPNAVVVPETYTRVPNSGTLRMLYLGRLHQKKGIDNLLEACAILPSSLAWSLDVVGAGDDGYVQSLHAKIARLGLGKSVRMRGLLVGHEKTRAFENADIAVFPSYTENFGMVVAEALAHGVPVITSKGMPWQRVEEVGCGLWIDNDPASLAAAIQRMHCMPLVQMGERGRAWIIRDFSWDEAAAEMIRVYNSACKCSLGREHMPKGYETQ